jgi:hypothetical protein
MHLMGSLVDELRRREAAAHAEAVRLRGQIGHGKRDSRNRVVIVGAGKLDLLNRVSLAARRRAALGAP